MVSAASDMKAGRPLTCTLLWMLATRWSATSRTPTSSVCASLGSLDSDQILGSLNPDFSMT